LIEHPVPGDEVLNGRPKKTIGSWVGIIYESLRDGRLHEKLMDALTERLKEKSFLSNGLMNGDSSNGHA
jgi:phenylalanine ammonia-lyase